MPVPTDPSALRDQVRDKYAAAAVLTTGGCCSTDDNAAKCCDATGAVVTEEQREQFGHALYTLDERGELPEAAVLASLGCGNPTAIAELHEGETVLDLGSGGGIDVLLSAKRVGPTGLAYGLDMTDEMLDLARRNQTEAGVTNVQWLRGHIENVPLAADTIDVIISNCVINLSADKPQVFREAARVLKPGGRFAVSDIVADDDMDDTTRQDMQAYTGCIAGALTRAEFTEQLRAAGLTDISIEETHRVHPAAVSAIIRAIKPAAGCCSASEQMACCEPEDKDGCCDTAATASGGCGCR
ncbi:MAG TPA: arsenite methyltransferase [Solirubrobacteraceae bacterium]|nr:arsenite methyltransferase [Solirubrobacteraceae bacterium]